MNRLAPLLALLPMLARAADTLPPIKQVPEPGTWALVALAGVIGVAVARHKRK